MLARWWGLLPQLRQDLQRSLSAYPSGHISKHRISINKVIPPAELGCKGPRSIPLPHPTARPVLKWKSIFLYRLHLSPEGLTIRQGRWGPTKPLTLPKQTSSQRMARTHCLPRRDRGLILTSSQHIVEEQISFPSIYNSTQFWRIHKNWFFTAFNSSPTCSNHHLFQFSQSNLRYFSACIWEHQKYQNTKQPRKALSQLWQESSHIAQPP